MKPPELSAEIDYCVPFHDLDPMAIVWHGNYARYFELARCALLNRIDFNYPQMEATGYLWPVIDLRVKYVRPLRFEQRIRILARLDEVENRLKISYRILDQDSGEVLTRGHSIQVAVHKGSHEMCLVSPPVLFEKLGMEVPGHSAGGSA